jgi:putative component of membrane protein insertase Oxa1/YidC/SpoIIIJ protein YidD
MKPINYTAEYYPECVRYAAEAIAAEPGIVHAKVMTIVAAQFHTYGLDRAQLREIADAAFIAPQVDVTAGLPLFGEQ